MSGKSFVCMTLLGVLLFVPAVSTAFAEDPSVPAVEMESKIGILKEMRVAPATLRVGSLSLLWDPNTTEFVDLEGNFLNWERFREHFKGRGIMAFYDKRGMVVEARAVLF